MTVLPMESVPESTQPEPQVLIPIDQPEPVLITEQEVLLGTAVAAGLPAEAAPGWLAAFRRVFAHTGERPERRRTYPARSTYLENSRMSREMWRL